jgi:5'-methylthioadenosine/S-adenosylhomocysteine nucleosidase
MIPNNKIDFAIITALPEELDAVLSKLGHCEPVGRKSDTLPFYRAEIGQAQVLVTRSGAGNIKAALTAATLLERYHPEYLLMVGIAAGFQGKVELGDVVIAESCYYDGPGKDTSDGKLPAPRQIPTGLLLARSKDYQALDWKENIHVQSPAGGHQPNIHHGVIASSETVIGDKRKMASLLATHRELRAVAMEGYGAADAAFGNKVDFLEIRGICDLGDENKDDKWHKYAADVVAAYAVGLLRYIESLPIWNDSIQQEPKDAKGLWWSKLSKRWQAVFKEAIGLEEDESPDEDELVAILGLTKLDCDKKKLFSLEPLRALTGLQELECDINELTSLEPLRALTGLQKLGCSNNQLTNLEPLRALTGLQSLSCEFNQLTNLEGLQALTGLQTLKCEYNQLTSLEPLRALTGLQTLYCNGNQLTSLEPLQALTGLQTLWCWSNQLTNLEGLQALTNLQTLWCSYQRLTNLEPLRALSGLQTLYCGSNQLTSLEPLRALTGLQHLGCDNNQLTSLKPLHGLKSLKKLACRNNRLNQQEIKRFKKAVPFCEVLS